MKLFDKERALAGDPVVTRLGLCVHGIKKNDCSVYTLIGKVGKETLPMTWTDHGKFAGSFIEKHDLDLFMAETECKCEEQSIEELKQKIITLEKALCRVECEKQKLYDECNNLAKVEKAHQEMVARLIKER